MVRRFTRAVRAAEIAGAVAAAAVLAILFLPRLTGGGNAAPAVEQPDLNVAVVPAADSAGFFVALHEGLFSARGLHVTFIPAISSQTVINAQALDEPRDRIDISCGNYVSYIQAQQDYDQGKRPSSTGSGVVAADLDIFAEGSVMEPGAQGLYVMPGAHIQSLADLEGKTIGVNAPGNILYLLAASALADHGLSVSGARFAYYPLPEMAAMLKAGKITAAVLPEPFASQAELSLGVTPLADLDQGATAAFPVQGCAVTRQWAARAPGDARGVPGRVRAGPADRGHEPVRRGAGHGGAPAAARPEPGAGRDHVAGFLPGRRGRRDPAAARGRRHAPVLALPGVQRPPDDRRLTPVARSRSRSRPRSTSAIRTDESLQPYGSTTVPPCRRAPQEYTTFGT